MSAKNKLKIASQLLKQASYLACSQNKQKLTNDLKNLQKFIQNFQVQNDCQQNLQKLALTILHQVIDVSMQKMCEFYNCYFVEQPIIQSQILEEVKHNELNKQQATKLLNQLLFQDQNSQIIKEMNINQFMKDNDIHLKFKDQ